MKKTTLLLSLLIGTAISFGQYSFSKTTGTYSDLSGSTSLTNGNTWDDDQFTIPLGFNFTYFDSTISTMYIEDYGLGAYLVTDPSETGIIPMLIPYGADITDRGWDDLTGPSSGGLSPISYLLTGTTGSRILKVEWKNVGFYDDIDDNGISTDFTNFQLWLYEGTNNIEIHFGPNSITQPALSYSGETGSSVELITGFDFALDEYGANTITLEGIPTAPTVKVINTFDSLEFLNGTIPNGTIYKFTKTGGTVGVKENNAVQAQIYPNPALSLITITSDNESINSVVITDVNGRIVTEIPSNFQSIDVSGLDSGIYFAQINTYEGSVVKRFVKK